jgi:AcrR family transcriptional regulator
MISSSQSARVPSSAVSEPPSTLPSATPPPDRRARRRAQTRRKLTDAARRLFAIQGVDNTRINEITDEADVGFGSFYNHFDSKEAIVEAVLAEALTAHGAAVDAATRDRDDPAEVVSVAHRYFVNLARTDPDWARLVVRLDASHNVLLNALGPFALRDLARGVRTGRFQVADKRTALFAAGGALLAVMRAVLDGQASRDADRHHAEGILRLFGLSATDAATVAARPFPTLRPPDPGA